MKSSCWRGTVFTIEEVSQDLDTGNATATIHASRGSFTAQFTIFTVADLVCEMDRVSEALRAAEKVLYAGRCPG